MLAIEVFGRPPGRLDPARDSIVRVEARRLHARLSAYYRSEGAHTPIRIELPVGSYVPLIASREPPQHAPQATRRARDLVERGDHFLRLPPCRASLEQSIERFDQALRESPDHAPALVGLGRAWLNLATAWYVEPAIASAHAAEALRRALEVDAEHAVAHVLLGALQHQSEYDWPGARRSFKRALALAPQLAFVLSAYGCHLFMHNALDEAEVELLLARQLDPQYINARTHMVNLRIAQARLIDAEAEIAAIQDIAPQTMAVATLRGLIALTELDPQAAITHYTRACELAADYPGCFIALAGAHAMAGTSGAPTRWWRRPCSVLPSARSRPMCWPSSPPDAGAPTRRLRCSTGPWPGSTRMRCNSNSTPALKICAATRAGARCCNASGGEVGRREWLTARSAYRPPSWSRHPRWP